MTSKKWLTGFLALNSFIQIGLFFLLKLDFPLVESYLKMAGCDTAYVLKEYFASAIIIIAPAGFLANIWINRGRAEGVVLAKFIGVTMLLAATNLGLSLHRLDLPAMDLVRSIPITLLAFMQKKQQLTA
ncbi:MAG: hypothetical protein JWQ38_3746 [Flavipsychrobacter sp.]|nr:hypothetical protein [Flavipsychrobacter sp.]